MFPETTPLTHEIPKLLSKGKDDKPNIHKFKTVRCNFSPIKLFRNQLVTDIDVLLEANEARPDVLITILHSLILNKSPKEEFDAVVWKKLIGDYFLRNPVFFKILEEGGLNPSKAKNLAKCMRYL